MGDENVWRKWINGLKVDDLPQIGKDPTNLESLATPAKETKLQVQKIVTVVYVFTELDKQIFGEKAYQDVQVLGEMTPQEFVKLLEKERKRRS